MKTVDRAEEVLQERLTRLRPAIRKILKRKPRPDAVLARSPRESGRAWFYAGMLIRDLAQLERLKHLSWNGWTEHGGAQAPEIEALKQLADGGHRAYYRALLAKFFAQELRDFGEVVVQWKHVISVRSGSEAPEELSPEDVAQAIESFWELLIAADFCERHQLMKKDSRTILRRLFLKLMKVYAQLPRTIRRDAAWYVNNFGVAVRFHPTEIGNQGFAGMAARLLGAV